MYLAYYKIFFLSDAKKIYYAWRFDFKCFKSYCVGLPKKMKLISKSLNEEYISSYEVSFSVNFINFYIIFVYYDLKWKIDSWIHQSTARDNPELQFDQLNISLNMTFLFEKRHPSDAWNFVRDLNLLKAFLRREKKNSLSAPWKIDFHRYQLVPFGFWISNLRDCLMQLIIIRFFCVVFFLWNIWS